MTLLHMKKKAAELFVLADGLKQALLKWVVDRCAVR